MTQEKLLPVRELCLQSESGLPGPLSFSDLKVPKFLLNLRNLVEKAY